MRHYQSTPSHGTVSPAVPSCTNKVARSIIGTLLEFGRRQRGVERVMPNTDKGFKVCNFCECPLQVLSLTNNERLLCFILSNSGLLCLPYASYLACYNRLYEFTKHSPCAFDCASFGRFRSYSHQCTHPRSEKMATCSNTWRRSFLVFRLQDF